MKASLPSGTLLPKYIAFFSKRPILRALYFTSVCLYLTNFCWYDTKAQVVGSAQQAALPSLNIPEGGLKIGDPIPEALWHLPLQVVNHPEGKDTITLNDYRGKLIILDFWATWCKGCLASIPGLHNVQLGFRQDLTILSMTDEPQEKVAPFLRTNQYVKSYNLCSVVNYGDEVETLFPHRILPHLVWISKQGIVTYTSTPEHVTAANIEKALSGVPLVGSIKKDIDTSKPLFLGEDLPESAQMDYYSVFVKGLVDGLPRSSRQRKAGKIVFGHYFSNSTIRDIYIGIAMGRIPNFSEDRMVYALNPKDEFFEDWPTSLKNKRVYTFDFILPRSLVDSLYAMMLGQLNKATGYCGQVKMIKRQCFVLSLTEDSSQLKSKGGKTASGFTPEGEAYFNNVTIGSLSNFLRNKCDLSTPVIIEGVRSRDRIDLKITHSLSDFPAVQRELRSHGISLVNANKEIPMFVISR